MSTENLFFLLIFVALPLFEWLSRVIRERQAEQRRRGPQSPPGEAPPVERPRRPPVEPPPQDRPIPPRPQTARPTAARTPPSAPAVVPAPRAAAPPAAAVVTTRSSWRRLDQLGLRGRPALRRALVARTILGPCVASRPHDVGHDA